MDISKKYLEKNDKAPKHSLAASVNEIIKLVGESEIHSYGYWLIKCKKVSYSTVLEICKEASQLGGQYNVGGYITNRLIELNQKTKK